MEFMKKVEEISKKVGSTATTTYNTVADKSGKLIEETKLKISISEKQTEIDEIFEEVGRTVYTMYKDGEDVGKEFTKEAKKVDKIYEEIENMNKKILLNKGLRICESCGETIPSDSKFCVECGEKQKPVKIKEEKKVVAKEEPVVEKVCPECGQVFEPTAKFCSKCGHKF